MKVTAITPQKRSKERVNLYLDGEYIASYESISLLENGIKVGVEITPEQLNKATEDSEYTSCFQRGIKYISNTPHTKKQVAGYLKEKGYQGYIIARVIDKLISYNYIDDQSFASTYADIKKMTHGKRAISYELKLKGVDEKTCENAVSEIDESEGAYYTAKKYLKGKFDKDLKLKAFRYLVSRGFDYDIAKTTLEKIEREYENNLS